ncbi:MAG: secondary thiamine-phosphate synthase enzyme YjbQ [Patescibacteria group bacterium]
MKIYKQKFEINSSTQIEFIDLTDNVQEIIDNSGIREGQVVVYSPHTTMGIMVNHNEPMLLQDFLKIFHRLVPVDSQYSHDLFELRRGKSADGRSNGQAHCQTILIGISETIPIEKGKMFITEKQSVFAVEFDGARKRDIVVQVIGM